MTGRPSSAVRRRRRGLSLLDVMVTLTVIAVVAAIVLPEVGDRRQFRLIAAARVLRSDLELAQTMTIADPGDPVVVRFEPAAGRYWLARAATPDTPLPRRNAVGSYTVEFGAGRARQAAGVTMTLTDITDATLRFNAQGGVSDPMVQPAITLQLESRWLRLNISPTTGSVTEESGP